MALHHQVEVDLVGVELGAVDADELALAADRDAATAAHPGAVDHDRVERHDGRDLVLLGHQRDELHHDRGPDGDHQVGLAALVDELLERVGDDALHAEAAVVGGVDHLVRLGLHLGPEDDEPLVAATEDRHDVIAGFLERAGDRQHGRDAGAAADADAGAEVLDVGRLAERPHHLDRVAGLHGAHLHRRLADLLDDQRDGAGLGVVVGDGQRDALAVLVHEHDDELAGLVLARDLGGLDDVALEGGCDLFFGNDLSHWAPSKKRRRGPAGCDRSILHTLQNPFKLK